VIALMLAFMAMSIDADAASAQPPGCDPLNLGSVHSGTSGGGQLQCDAESGGPLSFAIYTDPAEGFAFVDGAGFVTYTAPPDYKGADPFQVLVTDDSNGQSTTVGVSVQVVNQAPVCQPIDLGEIARGGVASGPAQCTDPDGDSLTYDIGSQPSKGTASVQGASTLRYAAAPGKAGPDAFVYSASDGVDTSAPATAAVTIHNAAPVCTSFAGSTRTSALSVPLKCTDADGDQLHLEIVQAPAPSEGALGAIDQAGASVTFTPAAGFSGNAVFQFRATDSFGAGSPATVAAIAVGPAGGNPPPPPDDTGCERAKQALTSAQRKLKKLRRADASKKKIAKAKARVRKAKRDVAAACGGRPD
jgi:hypothetical protein